jgi:hypothetical protein
MREGGRRREGGTPEEGWRGLRRREGVRELIRKDMREEDEGGDQLPTCLYSG